ncbi:uncharacterized protein [Ptychodera flava]|uniref:uncharacterized protein n=1 Tax=Ptychodera flava TaxID=63121 RepID=UPI003969FFC1
MDELERKAVEVYDKNGIDLRHGLVFWVSHGTINDVSDLLQFITREYKDADLTEILRCEGGIGVICHSATKREWADSWHMKRVDPTLVLGCSLLLPRFFKTLRFPHSVKVREQASLHMASSDGASYRWMREGQEPIKEDLGDWGTAIKTPPPLTQAQLAGLDGYDDVRDREPAEYISLPTPPRNSTPYQPRDRPPSISPPPRQAGPDAAWMDMMEKLVTNLQPRTNEFGWYRKLRVFSGRRPVPVNEDDYESWAEQAEQMIKEWNDQMQKRRNVSLKA